MYMGDRTGAKIDAVATLKVDQSTPSASYARGVLAVVNQDQQGQVAAMSQELALAPHDAFALEWRAKVYHRLHQDSAALADTQAALKLHPGSADLALLQANVQHALGDAAGALTTMRAALKANPHDVSTIAAAAEVMRTSDDGAEALTLLDSAIRERPAAILYYNRAYIRPKADLDGRDADLTAALALEPSSLDALLLEAQLLAERKDRPGALVLLNRALAISPNDIDLLINRAEVYGDAGQTAPAERDFAAARALAWGPTVLNNIATPRGRRLPAIQGLPTAADWCCSSWAATTTPLRLTTLPLPRARPPARAMAERWPWRGSAGARTRSRRESTP